MQGARIGIRRKTLKRRMRERKSRSPTLSAKETERMGHPVLRVSMM
jgi:hypothetical protein